MDDRRSEPQQHDPAEVDPNGGRRPRLPPYREILHLQKGISGLVGAKLGEPRPALPPTKNGSHTLGLRQPVRGNELVVLEPRTAPSHHRPVQATPACPDLPSPVTLILTIKLIKWADRWSPTT